MYSRMGWLSLIVPFPKNCSKHWNRQHCLSAVYPTTEGLLSKIRPKGGGSNLQLPLSSDLWSKLRPPRQIIGLDDSIDSMGQGWTVLALTEKQTMIYLHRRGRCLGIPGSILEQKLLVAAMRRGIYRRWLQDCLLHQPPPPREARRPGWGGWEDHLSNDSALE